MLARDKSLSYVITEAKMATGPDTIHGICPLGEELFFKGSEYDKKNTSRNAYLQRTFRDVFYERNTQWFQTL